MGSRSPKTGQAVANEDGGVTLMDRVLGGNGSAVTQSTFGSITLKVFEHDKQEDAENAQNGTELTGIGGTLTVSNVIYNTLQTAAPWNSTADAVGYNFRYDADETHLPNGSKWYRFEFRLVPAVGPAFWVKWVVFAEPMATS